MRDLDFCVILTTTLLSTYYHRDTLNKEYLKKYNDKFPQAAKLRKEIAATFDFIEKCGFDKRCRVWKKTDLFTLIVEINALIKDEAALDAEEVRTKLEAFYAQVDDMYAMKGTDEDLERKSPHPDVFRYLKAATKATNDKYARDDRAEIIAAIIQSTLKLPAKTKVKKTKK